MLTPCTVCSAHARLLRETSETLLEGGSTGHGRVADACMLLAVRSGANMVSGGEKSDDACLITTLESKIGAELCVRADVNLDEPYYGKLNDLLPLMAVHEQHNQRVLSKHRLAVDVQQSQAAAPLLRRSWSRRVFGVYAPSSRRSGSPRRWRCERA